MQQEKWKMEYGNWVRTHEERRSGERLRRLREGHGHAEQLFVEQVWWPAIGHLNDLHPEYEIYDFRDGRRYLDFAWICGAHRLAIEIDGYGPHLQKISRTQFSDQWMRQNHLVLDGWKVLRFSYDDVRERPRMCEGLIGQYFGRWFGTGRLTVSSGLQLTSEERDVLRLALRSRSSSVKPLEVADALQIEQQKTRRLLKRLVTKGYLQPGGTGTQRITRYVLSKSISLEQLGI